MIIKSDTLQVKPDLYSLGPAAMPIFLLDCETPVLFDAGMSLFAGHYIKQINKFLKGRKPAYLFLSHAHFDHCGSAGRLKEAFPDLTIVGSQLSAEIVKKQSAIDLIAKFNTIPGMDDNLTFLPFTIDRIVEDGEKIEISPDLSIEVISLPGHTRDMTGYYLPQYQTILPSESVGVSTDSGYIYSEFLIGYEIYLNSMEKLKKYSFDTLIMAHEFIYQGEDAVAYIDQSYQQTIRFKNRIEELLKQFLDDDEQVARQIKKEEYDPITSAKQPEPAYMMNLYAKIRSVKAYLGLPN